jgi:hypothetical protein
VAAAAVVAGVETDGTAVTGTVGGERETTVGTTTAAATTGRLGPEPTAVVVAEILGIVDEMTGVRVAVTRGAGGTRITTVIEAVETAAGAEAVIATGTGVAVIAEAAVGVGTDGEV